MAQVGSLNFKAFIEGRKGERTAVREASGHEYTYVSDKNTRIAFGKLKPVELAATAAVRMFRAMLKNQLLGNAVKVGPNQFPRVHALAVQCGKALEIATPALYIVNSPVMNAMTYGTNEESFIIVHSALIDHFTDEELLSVIGHEAGHIHNSHVVYLTALYCLRNVASAIDPRLAQLAQLSLSGWQRKGEITCDRAGLLCSKDLGTSTRALAKTILGSTKLYAEFNVEEFANQYEEGKEGVGKYAEVTASHPWMSKRLKALAIFAESELYRRHAGLGEGGLSMEQVDEKVHDIIKVIG